MSAQWNQHQQLSIYVFSKVIESLEQNIRKQIDCRRPSVQNKWVEYKIFELKYASTNITR